MLEKTAAFISGDAAFSLPDCGDTSKEWGLELTSSDISTMEPKQWITFRVSQRLTDDLNNAAKTLQTPRSRLIRTLIRDGLAQLQAQGLTSTGLAS